VLVIKLCGFGLSEGVRNLFESNILECVASVRHEVNISKYNVIIIRFHYPKE